MSLLEGITEGVLTTLGVDDDLAEEIGDFVSCGANLAMGNYAGAAADALDMFEVDDDLPWLAQGLEMFGGDPMAASMGLGGSPGLGDLLGQGDIDAKDALGIARAFGVNVPILG